MASEDFTTMPSEINWEEFLSPLVEFNNETSDGSLPEVDFPNNFNDQTSGFVDGNELPEAVAPPTQEVEFNIDEYFDIDEFLAAAYDGGLIGEGQPEMANGQFQEDWSFQNGPFEQMGFEQQDPVAAFNPAFMAPPATPFVTGPVTPFMATPATPLAPASVTPLVSAPVTPFDPAPATTPNPIPGTNSTNSTNISNIPPTDGSGRPHICPDPKCGARFAKRSALNTHMRSSKAHPHQHIICRCGKGFDKYGLTQHLKQQVKRCRESRADFRCHCGLAVGPRAEEEILEHAYNCSRIRGKADQDDQ
ncbi:hypothetical protein T069G_07981 [Trichoderma breve]|uniref:C2H2-type domain-containing protein n=1 Tax=Trichoderma breve TaxID=2034170 RepID=A0A9W9B6Y2_9HYPO|nr:hypothetical protein T069G_07981 [Trichoderma breve]KAJ4857084.1 hypothetical protein T069G_07981 [Trichoderma breve]